MISDLKKSEKGGGDPHPPQETVGALAHDSGFVFRRLDARAEDAGLSMRFRAILTSTGMPHAELAEASRVVSPAVRESGEIAAPFAARALREFGMATGVPATARVMLPAPCAAEIVLLAARAVRLSLRRVIVDLPLEDAPADTLGRARALAQQGFLVAARLTEPARVDPALLLELGADYLHVPTPPADFAEADAIRAALASAARRKARVLVGGVGTEQHARLAEVCGAGLTYGDFIAPARFLC